MAIWSKRSCRSRSTLTAARLRFSRAVVEVVGIALGELSAVSGRCGPGGGAKNVEEARLRASGYDNLIELTFEGFR